MFRVMRRRRGFLLLILLGMCLYAHGTHGLQALGHVSFGAALGGEHVDLPASQFLPAPDRVEASTLGISLAAYPLSWLGIEGGFSFFGSSFAVSADAPSSLGLYTYFALSGGPVFRYNLDLPGDTYLALEALGGLRFSFSAFAEEFLDVSGLNYTGIDPAPGWYAGARTMLSIDRFLVGLQLELLGNNGVILPGNEPFGGTYFMMHVVFGASFLR